MQLLSTIWMTVFLLLSSCLHASTAHFTTTSLTWDFGTYADMTASVGDRVQFTWAGGVVPHNIYRHPSGSCDNTDAIELAGTATDGIYTYIFASGDAGKTVSFSCDVGTHCSGGGMFVNFEVAKEKDGSCFSEATKVRVPEKGLVSIKDVRVNDWVQVGVDVDVPVYQRIYALGHYQPNKEASFLQFQLSHTLHSKLEVTGDHLLYLKENPDTPLPARKVQVGDVLLHLDADVQVTKIRTVTRKGLFAPLTESGTLMVNDGILASAYIAAGDHQSEVVELAGFRLPLSQATFLHTALSPLRLWCSASASASSSDSLCQSQHDETGMNDYVHYALKLVRWGEEQTAMVQWSVFSMAFCITSLVYALECAVGVFHQAYYSIPLLFVSMIAIYKVSRKYSVAVNKSKQQ